MKGNYMSEISLYNKVRPTKVSDLVGQPDAVKTLEGMISKKKIPHAILLTGPSGVGKTTIAHILKKHIKCNDVDYNYVNAADKGGIDTIRQIIDQIRYKPLTSGTNRLWLFDECHKLTSDAQDTLLVPLENPPKYVYFILCTTDPQKIKTTIKTRCTPINLNPLHQLELNKLIKKVAQEESIKLSNEVVNKISEIANGSARMALVLLEQISNIKSDEEKLLALQKSDVNIPAFDLCKAMFGWENGMRPDWPRACKVLEQIKKDGVEVEGIRQMVLSTCGTIILTKTGMQVTRALQIFQCFEYDFFATKVNGLIAATFRACNSIK